MWSIKFLSGPTVGKEIFLQPGLVILGRESSCQIFIPAEGVSKKHAQILVNDSGVFIEDMDSRNGIFIEGKQINRQKLKEGSRVVLSDVVFELRKKPFAPNFPSAYGGDQMPQSVLSNPEEGLQNKISSTQASVLNNFKKLVKSYLDNVVLPGIYKLATWIEFKVLVGGFIIAFVILITGLSAVPLVAILKSSVEQESRNNAENIAFTLATGNRKYLQKGLQDAVSVDYALRRPGVQQAFIISALDGRILAPAELAHTYPKHSLIHKARKQNKKTIEQKGSSVFAIIPISFYNPETGENLPRAYSVVIYDMSFSAIGTKKVISLITQTFLIACVIGFSLFFFLINLIEFPFKSLNYQLSRALKEDKSPSISIDYQSKLLTELCSHINSVLNQVSVNRMLSGAQQKAEGDIEINRQNEMNNLVEIIGFPALSIDIGEKSIASLNSNFSEQIGFAEILHLPLSEISDSRLKEHLLELVEQGQENPQEIACGEIQLNEKQLQSTCQFIMGKDSPAYAIVTFMSEEVEGAS